MNSGMCHVMCIAVIRYAAVKYQLPTYNGQQKKCGYGKRKTLSGASIQKSFSEPIDLYTNKYFLTTNYL